VSCCYPKSTSPTRTTCCGQVTSILVRHVRHARFPRDVLATSSRGFYDDAMRMLRGYCCCVTRAPIRLTTHLHRSRPARLSLSLSRSRYTSIGMNSDRVYTEVDDYDDDVPTRKWAPRGHAGVACLLASSVVTHSLAPPTGRAPSQSSCSSRRITAVPSVRFSIPPPFVGFICDANNCVRNRTARVSMEPTRFDPRGPRNHDSLPIWKPISNVSKLVDLLFDSRNI